MCCVVSGTWNDCCSGNSSLLRWWCLSRTERLLVPGLLLDLGVWDLSPEGRLWLGLRLRGLMFSAWAVSHANDVGGGLGEFVKSIILLDVFRRFLLGLSLFLTAFTSSAIIPG